MRRKIMMMGKLYLQSERVVGKMCLKTSFIFWGFTLLSSELAFSNQFPVLSRMSAERNAAILHKIGRAN